MAGSLCESDEEDESANEEGWVVGGEDGPSEEDEVGSRDPGGDRVLAL